MSTGLRDPRRVSKVETARRMMKTDQNYHVLNHVGDPMHLQLLLYKNELRKTRNPAEKQQNNCPLRYFLLEFFEFRISAGRFDI